MGKTGRRKQRQKRQQRQQQQQQQPDDSNAIQSVANSSSALHQLRNADPKTRHAALIALQATFLHPQNSKTNNKQVSIAVLQAIREQVMDSNLECACAAAECLAQYLSFADQEDSHPPSTTASWTLVLIGRLDQCHQEIQSKNNLKPWYALSAACLRTLCKLIETNELALEQMMNAQKQTYVATLFGLLHDAIEFKKEHDKTAANTTTAKDARLIEWVQETATYAARTLHSSLDDNHEMVQLINSKYFDPDQWAQVLQALCDFDLAQLHLCGSIVTLFQMAPQSWQSTCLMQQVLPCLNKVLQVDAQELQTMEDNYHQARILWQTQKEDDQLEQEVIQKVEDRKEPAKGIAKRQKAAPREKKKKSATMMETEQEDGHQAMEDALSAWNGVFMPLQVALEVTANLASCLIENPDEDMAIEKEDDSLDKILYQALTSPKVAERLLQVLQTLCVFQTSRDDDIRHEPALSEDLQESISKSAACLGNCVLSNVLTDSDYAATWQVLRPHATQRGVCGVLVVLTQRSSSSPNDLELVHRLLQTKEDEVQRDAVCLLAAMLPSQSIGVVTQATNELIRLMTEASSSTMVKTEVLSTIMQLYGQDEFYPQVFTDSHVLQHFQQCIRSIPEENLDLEQEDVVLNADRFVDYKQGR